MIRDNSRGLRRIARRIQSAFLPAVPFGPGREGKGPWELLTPAPRHLLRRYEIPTRYATSVRCAVLSDLHVGSQAKDLLRLQTIISEVAAAAYDLILFPGDFVNMQVLGGGRISPAAIANLLAPLAAQSPCVAVLGNHDAEYGAADVATALSERGIRVLFNESCAVQTRGGAIHVAGVEDHSTGKPDIAAALAGVPANAATLVLAHDPASFADVPAGPVATICGHTHGGQIRLPFVGAILNASEAPLAWTSGHIRERGRHLIVSAGLGTSGMPWRWNCPPEVVEICVTSQCDDYRVAASGG